MELILTGEVLKKKRQDLGLSIEEAADLLKIRAEYISAIENNSFEDLPFEVYTKGYIRAYAKYLNVNPDPIIEYYSGHLRHPGTSTIIPLYYSSEKGRRFYYVVPVIAVIAVAVYIFFSPAGKRTQVAVPEPVAGNTSREVDVRPEHSPEVSNKVNHKLAGIEHTLRIKASALTWVRIKFESGLSEEILFQPGESKQWVFSENVSLKIGNAGGINLRFDEKNYGAPGRPGQVITLEFP